MIASSVKKNFFAAHYELLVLVLGILALAGGVAFMLLGGDIEASVSGKIPKIPEGTETGVAPVDMEIFEYAKRLTKDPFKLPPVDEKSASYLASERRVYCAECAAPIPAEAKVCGFCKKEQPSEVKVVYDSDGDGLPDEWEKRYGLNINDASDADADQDGDLFTNREEFEAKTDPTDPKHHPPYVDYLYLRLPLKETKLPFYFDSVTKIPTGYRFKFIDPVKKDVALQRKGVTYTPLAGEEIGDTGFIAKSYEPKSEKRKIKGGKGMEKTVDISTATVVRKSDNKEIVLTVRNPEERGKPKFESVDLQATLVFERAGGKEFDVVVGGEVNLQGEKYRVKTIRNELGKEVWVLLEHATLGTTKWIKPKETP